MNIIQFENKLQCVLLNSKTKSKETHSILKQSSMNKIEFQNKVQNFLYTI